MNVAIVTARGEPPGRINKNLLPVLGQPMVQYPIKAAQAARRVGEVWVSPDGEGVAEAAREAGAKVIPDGDPERDARGDHSRPADSGDHGAQIKRAVEYVDAQVADLENVVVLLGSTVYLDGEIIDLALGLLADRKDLDSVMTVWEAEDDHPHRALQLSGDGLIEHFGGTRSAPGPEPRAYYYDQGLWAFRKATVQRHDGPSPWWWLGKRVHPIVRPWVTGRSLHGPIDVFFSEHWVQHPDVAKKLGEDNR